MKDKGCLIFIVVVVLYYIIRVSLLYYGNGMDEVYFSTGSTYHTSRCIFVNEASIEDSYESKEEAVEAKQKPCWLCVHDNVE